MHSTMIYQEPIICMRWKCLWWWVGGFSVDVVLVERSAGSCRASRSAFPTHLFCSHDAQSHRQTDRQTDRQTTLWCELSYHQRIRGYFYNEMHYINLRFTYLLNYAVTHQIDDNRKVFKKTPAGTLQFLRWRFNDAFLPRHQTVWHEMAVEHDACVRCDRNVAGSLHHMQYSVNSWTRLAGRPVDRSSWGLECRRAA